MFFICMRSMDSYIHSSRSMLTTGHAGSVGGHADSAASSIRLDCSLCQPAGIDEEGMLVATRPGRVFSFLFLPLFFFCPLFIYLLCLFQLCDSLTEVNQTLYITIGLKEKHIIRNFLYEYEEPSVGYKPKTRLLKREDMITCSL